MTCKYAIDFGTTNTSIAFAITSASGTSKPILIDLDPSSMIGTSKSLRSVFYADSHKGIHIGSDAIRTLRNEASEIQFEKSRWCTQLKMSLQKGEDIRIRGNDFSYDSVDLLTALFKYIKLKADESTRKIGITVKGVVIGVPVAFSESGKRTYLEALYRADFYSSMEEAIKETEFVSEPVAVAVNYGEKLTENKRVMVFDYGGGTLDISVIDLREQIGKNDKLHPHNVLGQASGYNIGGEEINRQFFLNFFIPKYGFNKIRSFLGVESKITAEPEELWELMNRTYAGIAFISQIELCKIQLSSEVVATFVPPTEVAKNSDALSEIIVTRDDFEEAVKNVFTKVDEVLKSCLEECKKNNPPVLPNQISDVLLAGGSALIPKVRDLIGKYIVDRSKIGANADHQLLPSEEVLSSIVRGLAIVGCKRNDLVSDILDCSYGVWDGKRNSFSVIIPQGTPISKIETDEFNDYAGMSAAYQAVDENATEMTIKIVQHIDGINNNYNKILKEIKIRIGGQYGTEFEFYLSVDKKLKMLVLKVKSVKKGTFYHIPKEEYLIRI